MTPSFRFCRLNEALAIARGTVWSFVPEMISSGPRSGFLVSTFASVQGLRLAVAAWKSGAPGAGTENCSYSSFASSSLDGVGEAVAELVVGERDGAVPVARVAEHRQRAT